MRCDKCKKAVNHLKYIRGYAFCWRCVLVIFLNYGIYFGKGKFYVEKFIIK